MNAHFCTDTMDSATKALRDAAHGMDKRTPGAAERALEALAAGADPWVDECYALRTACARGHLAVVEQLLARNAEGSAFRGRTAEEARGHLAVVERLLLARNAERSAVLGHTAEEARAYGDEALRDACRNGHAAVVSRLFARNAGSAFHGLTADDARAGNNAALRAACAGGHLAVVEVLFSHDVGLTAEDARARDNEALRAACANGHLAVVSRLFEAGLTAEDARAADNTALGMACAHGHLEVVERLFEAGLTADDARARYSGALRGACGNGHLEVVDRLLTAGLTAADVRASCNEATRAACENGQCAVIERLFATPQGRYPRFCGLTAADAQGTLRKIIGQFYDERLLIPTETPPSLVRGIGALLVHCAAPPARALSLLAEWAAHRPEEAAPFIGAVFARWAGTPELEAAEAELREINARAAKLWDEATRHTHTPPGGLRFAD